jgi:hypothetical protein
MGGLMAPASKDSILRQQTADHPSGLNERQFPSNRADGANVLNWPFSA